MFFLCFLCKSSKKALRECLDSKRPCHASSNYHLLLCTDRQTHTHVHVFLFSQKRWKRKISEWFTKFSNKTKKLRHLQIFFFLSIVSNVRLYECLPGYSNSRKKKRQQTSKTINVGHFQFCQMSWIIISDWCVLLLQLELVKREGRLLNNLLRTIKGTVIIIVDFRSTNQCLRSTQFPWISNNNKLQFVSNSLTEMKFKACARIRFAIGGDKLAEKPEATIT